MTGHTGPQALARRAALCWRTGLVGLLTLAGAPVQAGLVEAVSPHFTIYADAPPAQLHDLAQKLERFRQALEHEPDLGPPPNGEAPLTIYVARSQAEVRKLFGALPESRHVKGFYLARSEGSLAVIAPDVLRRKDGYRLALHEYVHHTMAARGQGGVPGWVSEGAAEHYSAATFAADGSLAIGLPQRGRLAEIRKLPAPAATAIVADPDQRQGLIARRGAPAYYAKSWLLYRHLQGAPQRSGQLSAYLDALGEGIAPAIAARSAFGDLAQLESELVETAGAEQPAAAVRTVPVSLSLRQVPRGEERLLPLVLQARAGLIPDEAHMNRARRIVRRHPEDIGLSARLAVLEGLTGQDRAALALADRVLAQEPGRVDALRVRAQALIRLDDPARSAAVLAWLQAEPDSAAALAARFRLAGQDGGEPDAAAAAGLVRAVQLAPWDPVLRLDLAEWQQRSGDWLAARATLIPLAHSAAGGAAMQVARGQLAELAAREAETATAAAGLGRAAVRWSVRPAELVRGPR